jgi:hypothetical protein
VFPVPDPRIPDCFIRICISNSRPRPTQRHESAHEGPSNKHSIYLHLLTLTLPPTTTMSRLLDSQPPPKRRHLRRRSCAAPHRQHPCSCAALHRHHPCPLVAPKGGKRRTRVAPQSNSGVRARLRTAAPASTRGSPRKQRRSRAPQHDRTGVRVWLPSPHSSSESATSVCASPSWPWPSLVAHWIPTVPAPPSAHGSNGVLKERRGDGDPVGDKFPARGRGWGEDVPRDHSRGRGQGISCPAVTGMGMQPPTGNSPLPSLINAVTLG